MVDGGRFVEAAYARGFAVWSGVPCSYLTAFLNRVAADPALEYLPASSEGEAVAIAAGAHLGGRRGVALFQNSGLGNAVNPLSSLLHAHRIPVLLIVSLRGDPGGAPDEPQHALMGRITTSLLELLEVRWELFPDDDAGIEPCLDRALAHMQGAGGAYCLVLRHGAVAPGAGPAPLPGRDGTPVASPPRPPSRRTRRDFLAALHDACAHGDILVSTTGYTSRELYALGDRPNHFYLVGAMGCASSVALGLALARPNLRVTVLDGDGAALMRMGAMAAIGYRRPSNLLHIVLDNGVHESTGGQPTVSASADLAAVAAACGYPDVLSTGDPHELAGIFAAPRDRLRFVHAAVAPGVPAALPRPKVGPAEVARRLERHVAALEGGR